MTHILGTVTPVFALILLGWYLRHNFGVAAALVGPANRFVFSIALPALVFRQIGGASFSGLLGWRGITTAVAALLATSLLTLVGCLVTGLRHERLATFVQCSYHGNITQIGFAVAFLHLGRDVYPEVAVVGGSLVLVQNLLSSALLQGSRRHSGNCGRLRQPGKVVLNPIIIATLLGLGYSVAEVSLPAVFVYPISALGALALPLALLVMGASLSFRVLQEHAWAAAASSAIKLAVLPAMGYLLGNAFRVQPESLSPVLILLASPCAMISFVMAGEMDGDPELAATSLSISTTMSIVTIPIWIVISQ